MLRASLYIFMESKRGGGTFLTHISRGEPSHAYLVVLDRANTGETVRDRRVSIVARHDAADELEPLG